MSYLLWYVTGDAQETLDLRLMRLELTLVELVTQTPFWACLNPPPPNSLERVRKNLDSRLHETIIQLRSVVSQARLPA